MSLREIIKVPNPFLKVTAKPVTVIDEDILTILDDMMETMYHAKGIGLAATQIAIDKRLIVMDCGKTKYETQNISEEEYDEKIKDEQFEPFPIKMINPEIISLGKNLEEREEGCLSIPGYNAKIKRPSSLKVKYTDENKKDKIIDADGLLATCIQHEIDHLNGVLFIDYLSKLKKDMIIKKLVKHKKEIERIVV